MLTLNLLISACCLLGASASFDWAIGNSSVWLSAAAYCEQETYLTRTFKGYSAGFTATDVIYNKADDVQGYIGFNAAQSSIYVVFRGSTSIQDWMNNLDVVMTDYPCSGCEVHKGFLKAQQSVLPFVTEKVTALLQKYPSYAVVVTGHSLGAAMATLTINDLKKTVSASRFRLFNFGSPRIGNEEFASYTTSLLGDDSRVTHHKDMVVHTPMHERFTHIAGEWYQDENDVLNACVGYEDSNCSYQWHITSIDDHMN
ncbi:Alpha/Beta hydrolase protein, partial [Ochromonadaceae sp. CCMP2298]